MKNRAILAREKAKGYIPEVSIEVEEPVVEKTKIATKDPKTGEIVEIFESLEEAIDKGFDKTNINKAIKNGTKYKGFLWNSENQLL